MLAPSESDAPRVAAPLPLVGLTDIHAFNFRVVFEGNFALPPLSEAAVSLAILRPPPLLSLSHVAVCLHSTGEQRPGHVQLLLVAGGVAGYSARREGKLAVDDCGRPLGERARREGRGASTR